MFGLGLRPLFYLIRNYGKTIFPTSAKSFNIVFDDILIIMFPMSGN